MMEVWGAETLKPFSHMDSRQCPDLILRALLPFHTCSTQQETSVSDAFSPIGNTPFGLGKVGAWVEHVGGGELTHNKD